MMYQGSPSFPAPRGYVSHNLPLPPPPVPSRMLSSVFSHPRLSHSPLPISMANGSFTMYPASEFDIKMPIPLPLPVLPPLPRASPSILTSSMTSSMLGSMNSYKAALPKKPITQRAFSTEGCTFELVADQSVTVRAGQIADSVPDPGKEFGKNRFKCAFAGCGLAFHRRYNLKVHLRKHTGETPYKCEVPGCNSKFKWRSSAKHHKSTHFKNRVKKTRKERKPAVARSPPRNEFSLKQEFPVPCTFQNSAPSPFGVLPPVFDPDTDKRMHALHALRMSEVPDINSSGPDSVEAIGPASYDPFADPDLDLGNISDSAQYNSQSDEDRLFFPRE